MQGSNALVRADDEMSGRPWTEGLLTTYGKMEKGEGTPKASRQHDGGSSSASGDADTGGQGGNYDTGPESNS